MGEDQSLPSVEDGPTIERGDAEPRGHIVPTCSHVLHDGGAYDMLV